MERQANKDHFVSTYTPEPCLCKGLWTGRIVCHCNRQKPATEGHWVCQDPLAAQFLACLRRWGEVG